MGGYGWSPEEEEEDLPANYVGRPGFREPGNIDLAKRPVVRNPDGSISTVRSASFNFGDGKETLIPTVADDGSRILSDDEAVAQYRKTGGHLGRFGSTGDATSYAKSLHDDQAEMYADKETLPPPMPPVRPGSSYDRSAALSRAHDRENSASITGELVNNITNAFTRKPVQGVDRSQLFAKQRAEMASEEGRARAAAESDPASEASQSYRAMVRQAMPEVADQMGKQFDRLTPKYGAAAFPFLKENWATARAAAKAKTDAAQRAEDQRLAREKEDRGYTNAKAVASITAGNKKAQEEYDRTQDLIKLADDQRKEFSKDADVVKYKDSAASVDILKRLSSDDTGASDMAFIYNFMKALDPSSSVKEGEYKSASEIGGITDNVRNKLRQFWDGGKLNAEQRASMVQAASGAVDGYRVNFDSRVRLHRQLATQRGIRPDDIGLPPDENPGGNVAPGQPYKNAAGKWVVRE